MSILVHTATYRDRSVDSEAQCVVFQHEQYLCALPNNGFMKSCIFNCDFGFFDTLVREVAASEMMFQCNHFTIFT